MKLRLLASSREVILDYPDGPSIMVRVVEEGRKEEAWEDLTTEKEVIVM